MPGQKAKGWLMAGTLLLATASPLAPIASAQRGRNEHRNDRGRYYEGMRNNARDQRYDQRYSSYNRTHPYPDGYYRDDNGGGVGPGYGALIGGGGGAALGAIFGGGLKGTLIGGAAGAALGALGGKLAQDDDNNHHYYPR